MKWIVWFSSNYLIDYMPSTYKWDFYYVTNFWLCDVFSLHLVWLCECINIITLNPSKESSDGTFSKPYQWIKLIEMNIVMASTRHLITISFLNLKFHHNFAMISSLDIRKFFHPVGHFSNIKWFLGWISWKIGLVYFIEHFFRVEIKMSIN